jgi:hypothetical protein
MPDREDSADEQEQALEATTSSGTELAEEEKSPGQPPGHKLQAKWDEMYKRLLSFHEKHGHCLVPNRYSEDAQLGSWGKKLLLVVLRVGNVFVESPLTQFRYISVSTQRRHYKILTSGSGESTPMTPARAQKLVDIGFKWSTKDPRHVPWEQRYSELVAFNVSSFSVPSQELFWFVSHFRLGRFGQL